MKGRALVVVGLLVIVTTAQVWANEQLRVPQDIQPPVYLGGGGPGILPNGSFFLLHDGHVAAIPFWRPLASVPADFNLLENFDPAALQSPLLIEGSVRFQDGGILSWEARGTGAVPVLFVPLEELVPVMTDGDLTIEELAAMPSLLVGTAEFYHEQNHSFYTHPVSHLAVIASGTLEDGRSFYMQFVEVDLALIQARIVFE